MRNSIPKTTPTMRPGFSELPDDPVCPSDTPVLLESPPVQGNKIHQLIIHLVQLSLVTITWYIIYPMSIFNSFCCYDDTVYTQFNNIQQQQKQCYSQS